jgi:CRP/FNR family transcriptional regulator, nitrogen oxide reductase regulator
VRFAQRDGSQGCKHEVAGLDRSLVAHLPVFSALTAPEVDHILGEARLQRVPKNASVFEQGGDAHSFFVLLQGRVRAVKVTPEGEQLVMRYIGPGELFGIAASIGRTTYPATAYAAIDSVMLAWPSASWPRLAQTYPSLAQATLQTVGERLEDAHARVIEMSTEEVERRVARAVLRLVKDAGRKVEGGVQIDFPISRQDIAGMTGTTLHTVSRILSAWEEQGIVEGGRQRIVLRDSQKLSVLAEGDAE